MLRRPLWGLELLVSSCNYLITDVLLMKSLRCLKETNLFLFFYLIIFDHFNLLTTCYHCSGRLLRLPLTLNRCHLLPLSDISHCLLSYGRLYHHRCLVDIFLRHIISLLLYQQLPSQPLNLRVLLAHQLPHVLHLPLIFVVHRY